MGQRLIIGATVPPIGYPAASIGYATKNTAHDLEASNRVPVSHTGDRLGGNDVASALDVGRKMICSSRDWTMDRADMYFIYVM
jgi:hypothetical protein